MRVLVVLKVPKLDVLEKSSRQRLAQLETADPGAYKEIVEAAETQRSSNEVVVDELERAGCDVTVVMRDAFESVAPDVDLVVAVGGDGTVLDVSHRVIGTPLLGINSDPARSVGYFSATNADGVGRVIEAWQSGYAAKFVLHRIAISIDGDDYPFPCMNDLLVTNENPGMMSRYVLTSGLRSELQSSSGIWISTPAGSTAGIRSAGGTVMPLEGALIQYLVREPFMPRNTRFELLRGVRHLSEGLEVRSRMSGGRIYVDGPYLTIPFELGATAVISEGPSLTVIGLDPQQRER